MVQLNQHLRHYDLYCGATMSPRLHIGAMWTVEPPCFVAP